MSDLLPVVSLAELAKLDDSELVAGYLAGYNGDPAPDATKSRAYHHGYNNGAVDAGRRPMTNEQRALAAEIYRWHWERRPLGRLH